MEKLLIRKQSLEEMEQIYQGMMTRHFPADEIKPFGVIRKGYEAGRYEGYGLYEAGDSSGGECLAYAWMCGIPEENWTLLDYYAVAEHFRGQGIGSWFLRKLLEEYAQETPVMIEVEDPDRIDNRAETEREKEQAKRLRRISFYLRNGVKETSLRARVFQVPYRIMVYAQSDAFLDKESLKRAYYRFYSHTPENVAIGETHENEQL